MTDTNEVALEGDLTWDPIYIEKEGRAPVCLLCIECNRHRRSDDTGIWDGHARFFNVTVEDHRAEEVATVFVKGERVLVKGYLDWYDGAESCEFVTIVAWSTPDGITRVVKVEEQSQASTASDVS